jgi:hypothetical protein
MNDIVQEMRDMEWSAREAKKYGNAVEIKAIADHQLFLRREFRALKLLERWERDNGRIV